MNQKETSFLLITTYLIWFLMSLSGCQNRTQAQIEFNHDEVDLDSYRIFSWPDDKPMIKRPNHLDSDLANQIKQ